MSIECTATLQASLVKSEIIRSKLVAGIKATVNYTLEVNNINSYKKIT